ncbi:Crossover junction endodeoxyribonuclease rusA [Serratia rubidaea]|nr:Crossover junction endodeoxyribonuclease rusA [Serratia rubidaea]
MILTLPFPPSVNGYWRAPNKGSLRGRHLISDRGRKFNSEALASILEQLNRKPRALTCDLAVSVVFYPPSRARRDLDNYFKALFDAMTKAGIWLDDSQIKKLSAEWGPVTKGGKVELRISEVGV